MRAGERRTMHLSMLQLTHGGGLGGEASSGTWTRTCVWHLPHGILGLVAHALRTVPGDFDAGCCRTPPDIDPLSTFLDVKSKVQSVQYALQ